MTDQQRVTTIERGYGDGFGQSEGSLSATSLAGFFFVAGQVAKYQAALPTQISPASLHCTYLERAVTRSASALIEGDIGLGTVTQELFLPLEPQTGGLQRPRGIPSRRERYVGLIALIESWLADESGYDEAVWPRLKARIEESRTSSRKRFSD